MVNFVMSEDGKLINLDDVVFSEYDDSKSRFNVSLKDESDHIIKRLPYSLKISNQIKVKQSFYKIKQGGR